MVQVKLMSPQLRQQHGRRHVEMEAPDVEAVLTRLGVEELVNGRAIQLLAGCATELGPGDTVSIFYIGIRGWPGG